MAKNVPIWIGGHRHKNESVFWKWRDASTWSYTNWASGEPNNLNGKENDVILNLEGPRMWSDADGQLQFPFICQDNEKGICMCSARN